MSRSLKEIAKTVRENLKKEFPNCKFSVRTEYYSMGQSLHVALMAAPFEAYADAHRGNQLNHYAFDARDEYINNGVHLTKEAWDVLKRANEIANKENWDESDRMSDYVSVNYFFHLYVGKWDKPFQVTA